MNPPELTSARECLQAMAAGHCSSRELVSRVLQRIDAHNPALNALVHVAAEDALRAADAADRSRCAGRPPGPLHGLPMTVKDTLEVAGMPCTAGSPAYRHYHPRAHAPAVQRLVDAGAVIIGKTNVPLFGGDIQTDNALFGDTRNPRAAGCNAGGSSGGAAAAVAAGLVPLELGSDLAGSLRIPAHCCGVAALRPTTGTVPAGGQLMGTPGRRHPPHMLTVGPLANDCDDLRLALSVLTDIAAFRPAPVAGGLAAIRVRVWLDDAQAPVDDASTAVLSNALDHLCDDGLVVSAQGAPVADTARMFRLFLRLMYAALSHEFPSGLYRRLVDAAPPLSADTDLPALLPAAVAVRHRDWLAWREAQASLAAAMNAALGSDGLLACPVLHRSAWPTDERPLAERDCVLGGEARPWMQQAFWTALPALAGLPAVVIPAGADAAGRPVGLQLIGRAGSDFELLARAGQLQQALGRHGLPVPG